METHPGKGANHEAPFHLTLFASVLLRRPFDALTDDDATIVRWAATEAARWCADGRAADLSEEVLAYRFVYRSLRAQAADAGPIELAERGPRWEKVLRAACMLRHRQRAVLALYYCGGLSPRDAGIVVRASETQARAVVESAVAAVAKMLGEPVDVRRSLRMASARLRAQREDAETEVVEPKPISDRPRAVMQTWIARPTADGLWPVPIEAPLVAPSVAQNKGSPVRALLADIVPAAPATVAAPKPIAVPSGAILPVRPRADRRGLFAAVAAMLVLTVLAPGFAGEQAVNEPSVAAPAPVERVGRALDAVAVSGDVGVLGKVVVRVKRGDSLWALALEVLGDGARWRAIWNRNRGRMMAGGERFTKPDLILPGWSLVLPRGARAA